MGRFRALQGEEQGLGWQDLHVLVTVRSLSAVAGVRGTARTVPVCDTATPLSDAAMQCHHDRLHHLLHHLLHTHTHTHTNTRATNTQLAKLLCASMGRRAFSLASFDRAVQLERMRKARVAAAQPATQAPPPAPQQQAAAAALRA